MNRKMILCITCLTTINFSFTGITGPSFSMEISPEDSFNTVIQTIQEELGELSGGISMDLLVMGSTIQAKVSSSNNRARNYNTKVSSKEKGELTYIVKTLSSASVIKLASAKSSLRRAGDKLDNVHPLKFLEAIITDDELRVALQNMRGRSMVWGEFLGGITDSLAKESAANNLKPEYLVNFSQTTGVPLDAIKPSYEGHRWKEFVNAVVDNLPKREGANRYDM